jgi:hypothetical protein
MSIKYLNPKSYGQVYQKLVNGYRKVKGKDPTGLDLIKIKLEAAEQIRNSEKIIKFPEEKITPFYEGRPSKGPQADVKKFPTKNKPAAQTYSSDFLDLLEEFNKISKNQPSLAEITGVSNKYPEKTGIVKSTIELLESKDPKSLSRELQRIMKREGTYVDYSDEEVAQILNGFESRTKNKIKPAEDMIDEGDFDPSGFAGGGLAYMLGEPVRMFKGGRIGYSIGAGKKGVQGLLDLVKNKFGKKSITTADKIARPEKAITKEMFDAFNKRLKEKARGTYRSGEDLYKILKKEGITMDQAVKEAIDDMPRLSGDAKYDADAVADVMYEKLGIDPDTLNQYHLLDAYDNAYQQLIKQKRKSMYQKAADDSLKKMDPEAETYAKELEYDVQEKISEPGYRGVVTEASDLDDTLKIIKSQKSEATKLREKYPGISKVLLDKIVKDNNPQRKAEVLASLDEVLTMMDKGMDEKQIMDVLRKTTRTKNATGGRIGYTNGGVTKTKTDYEKELETKNDYEKEDNKILDILDLQVQGAMSGKQQIEGAPPGITSDLKTLEIIANFDIPLDDKINLYANYQRNKSRNRIEKADQEVYLGEGAYRNREVGLNYNKDGEGFSADAKYNMDSEEPEFRFKYKKLFGGPKKRAKGGRIGFSVGGIDKVRRAFLKLLGAGAGATAATKTGLFGLLKGKKEAKIATKAAEQVVKRNEPPAYVFDLVEIIRAKGKDITKSAQTIERETVKTYKGVDLYETPDGFRIRAEGKSAQEGGKEIDLMYSQMDEIKDEGLETQKSFTVTDYEEATVRPDAEGKMKDVDFYVDEADHKELKKIVDEEKNKFKSGGLAYMLGE